MIILTNCLTDTADEGCLKVANSLIARLRKADPNVTVVSYGEDSPNCDVHLPTNKLMLNWKLARFLRRRREPVLYIPTSTRMLPAAARIFLLSLFAGRGITALLAMKYPIGRAARLLLRASRAQVITLSDDSWQAFREVIGDRAVYLKTGVDTNRFAPVPPQHKMALREKYGIPADKPVVLHVGHMTAGRNVAMLAELDERFHVVLVVSTWANREKDEQLRRQLEEKKNITIIDSYIPQIEEIYQLSDVYLFPVEAPNNCIDVPLSALEAAACGLPVAATPYGELRQLLDKDGFYRIESFEPQALNALLAQAAEEGKCARESVLPYDWNASICELMNRLAERT